MRNFFEEVYNVVRNIPKGFVMNYGMVAEFAGNKRMARQVGYALHCNPDQNNIPCHRVVMRDGSLAEGFAFGGKEGQRKLLEAEGITFIGEKVDIEKHLCKFQ